MSTNITHATLGGASRTAILLTAAAFAITVSSIAAISTDSQPAESPPTRDQQPEPSPVISPSPAPTAADSYETAFFEALNGHPDRRESALALVRSQVVKVPDDARAVLLLGIGHLWTAAENPPKREVAIEHLILARHSLERASRLNPADDRIASWLLSAEVGLAEAEGREADAVASLKKLLEHARRDPCFHSVAYAISVWEGPRDRAELAEAQKLLEAAAACNADDPSVRNMSRWPHNVEGFLVGLSDVALKRGDRARAMACLVAAESWPGAEKWPHLSEVEHRRRDFAERAARFADADPGNDPRFIFERGGPVSCIACHGAQPPVGR